ncbi:MAG: phage holin family protein [Prevotella sp.]|jgi:hypothetical protein|nr:phage holin family protein [Prevotella sp.]
MELLTIFGQTFNNVIDRIIKILSSLWGWTGSFAAFVFTWLVTWLGDTREMCLYLVLAAIILDLIWGIASSAKRGVFAMSIGFTKTVIKLAIYVSILALVAFAEKAIADDWNIMFRMAAAILIVAEAVSISGHILIIKPDTPVIRLLWRVLKSEIAKKLGIDVKNIDEFINKSNNEKN